MHHYSCHIELNSRVDSFVNNENKVSIQLDIVQLFELNVEERSLDRVLRLDRRREDYRERYFSVKYIRRIDRRRIVDVHRMLSLKNIFVFDFDDDNDVFDLQSSIDDNYLEFVVSKPKSMKMNF